MNPGDESSVNKTFLRRALPVAAALLVGSGAGAAIYAGTNGSSGSTSTTVVASVPAQPAATSTTGLTQLYKDAAPGVVDITVNTTTSGFGGFGDQQATAEGSGFEIDSNGDIVTNQHVVNGATAIKVRFQSGKTATAKLVGTDESTDIAVIKVDVPSSQLHHLSFGSSAGVSVGLPVAAI